MNVVDTTTILNDALDVGVTIISAAVPVVLPRILTLLHVSATGKARDIVEAIVDNGIAFALQKGRSEIAAHGQVQVSNVVMATAAQYVLNKAPGSLKLLGIDISSPAGQQHVADMITARIPQVLNSLNVPSAPAAPPVDPASPAGLAQIGANAGQGQA